LMMFLLRMRAPGRQARGSGGALLALLQRAAAVQSSTPNAEVVAGDAGELDRSVAPMLILFPGTVVQRVNQSTIQLQSRHNQARVLLVSYRTLGSNCTCATLAFEVPINQGYPLRSGKTSGQHERRISDATRPQLSLTNHIALFPVSRADRGRHASSSGSARPKTPLNTAMARASSSGRLRRARANTTAHPDALGLLRTTV